MIILAATGSGEGIMLHLNNWVTLLGRSLGDSSAGRLILRYEMIIFSAFIIALLAMFFISVSRKMELKPGKMQVAVEDMVMGLDSMVCDILGAEGRKYTPFIGTLFLFIFTSNILGLFPLMNSSTADLRLTAALSLGVFFYVQWIGIRKNGIIKYLHHFAGSPGDAVEYILAPLNFVIHVLGELFKPVSLMFRLFGNIMAGHILMAVFLGLGMSMMNRINIPIGFPLQFPFYFLEIIVATVQALVFAILSTVYISMMLPHEEH